MFHLARVYRAFGARTRKLEASSDFGPVSEDEGVNPGVISPGLSRLSTHRLEHPGIMEVAT